MEIDIKYKIKASEIKLSEQELLEHFIKNSGTPYSMYE